MDGTLEAFVVGILDADGLSLCTIVGRTDSDGEVGSILGDLEGCCDGCHVGFFVGCKMQKFFMISPL